jgi:lipopolysaccharide export system ATP-binding protein
MLPPDVTVSTLLTSAGVAPTTVPDQLQASMDQPVRTLSGGERRLLEVEIVLGLDRDYVLLDEPFTGVEPLLIDTISQRIEAAAAQGTGILVTDHYHQYVMPLTDVAYVMWQKQCYQLDTEEPIPEQLERLGYLRLHASS